MYACLLSLALLSAAPQPYEQALRNSQESGKPLVIMLTADWCVFCPAIKSFLLDLSNRGKLDGCNFTLVDFDRQAQVREKLTKDDRVPHVIVLRKVANGWAREDVIGNQTNTKIRIEDAIDKALKRSQGPETVAP